MRDKMIGIDIVSINRIEKMIEKFGDKALRRFLSQEEMLLVKRPSTAAGFWAAKEAANGGVPIRHSCIATKTVHCPPYFRVIRQILANIQH